MIDNSTLLFAGIGLALYLALRVNWKGLVVEDHEVALVERRGKLIGPLPSGVHRFWPQPSRVIRVDTRQQTLLVRGQELLTADRVPVKVSLVVRYRVIDALLVHRTVEDLGVHLHHSVQLAAREEVCGITLDSLLEERSRLSEALTQGVELGDVGLELAAIEVLDVMVAGDLKRAYSEAARARAEGLAKLERARGETAALRKLANAARLIDEHAGLDRLRTLEVMERAIEGGKSTFVVRM